MPLASAPMIMASLKEVAPTGRIMNSCLDVGVEGFRVSGSGFKVLEFGAKAL